MGYEEVMLAIKERKARETQTDINRHKALHESVSNQVDTQSIYDKLYSEDTETTRYNDFRQSVTESYIVEALTILVDNCLENHLVMQECHQKLVRQLVSNFVKEEGASSLLRKMKFTSNMMSEIAYVCEKAIQNTISAANKTGNLKLDKPIKDTFYDDLKDISSVDATVREITNRVRESTSEFIQQNMEEKAKLSDALAKTNAKVDEEKAKIENTPDASEETKEQSQKMQEAYINQGKREVIDIRESRVKNVFECMVYNLSKGAMINESAKDAFMVNSRLDMDKIVEHCEVLYTFLTCMDSCKLINVDEAFITDMLNSLKG